MSAVLNAGTALAAPLAAHAVPVCPDTQLAPGAVRCLSWLRTDVAGLRADGTPNGYGPADLQSAYALPSATAGTGQTVAIVDAFDNPNAEADMNTYRQQYGLPPCTSASGCFRKVNQYGLARPLPSANAGWAVEISLDLDMVSATCPNCKIILVEATFPTTRSLGIAVDTAARLGATAISNSYGGPESSAETDADAHYNHPGIAVTVSAGDSGYGVEYPAASPYVIAVGGTSLSRDSSTRGWTETVWGAERNGTWEGTGSGCSQFEAKPAWQHDGGCANRTVTDVAAVADPATGVAIYDTYGLSGWLVVGGTSAAAPIIAGVYALAGNASATDYPATYTYSAPTGSLNDVTSGTDSQNGCSPTYLCTGIQGYDGPTGNGTPNGGGAF